MTPSPETIFLCPQCGDTLPVRPPCKCGFVLRESDGIIDFLTEDEASTLQPFLEAYDRVRSDERWGGDDLDLPFHPRRHHDIWNIRSRTFRALEAAVSTLPRGLALDIGAGNCWMTRYLDRWGFDAIALDINCSEIDGLRAGQKFINEGARFLRARSTMERLPFVSGRIRLVATSASFHYASNFRAALAEFKRVLTPGGMIAITDTPVYREPGSGERMVSERVVEFRQKYGIAEPLSRRAQYMTYKQIEELGTSLNLGVRIQPVWPGFARKYEEVRAAVAGRQIAGFPLVVMEKSQ
jgi:SAM-dependent methyltransferase